MNVCDATMMLSSGCLSKNARARVLLFQIFTASDDIALILQQIIHLSIHTE